jgi:hypothetical protein
MAMRQNDEVTGQWCATMPKAVHRLSVSDPHSWYRTQRKTIGAIVPSGNIVVVLVADC